MSPPKKEDDSEKTHLRAEDLHIKGPLGWSVRANGQQAGLWIVLVFICGLLFWMLREHDIRSSEQLLGVVAGRQAQVNEVMRGQHQLQESMETIVYILSLDPHERAQLKLAMPPALRAKLLNQERPR